jgi:hypothetical protein
MNNADIVVEAVWSSPQVNIFFLELCEIYVQIRNKLDRSIQIQKVECHFQCEDNVEPYIPRITPHLSLKSGQLSHPAEIRLKFEADIALKNSTNGYRIVITYLDTLDSSIRVFEHNPHKYFILSPAGPNEKLFFISHKDPENTNIGRSLSRFLGKLGFIGYLSEDDRRPGIDLWKKKIPSTIESSVAMIILWTSEAALNPDNIYRELYIAKSSNKRLIMVREKDVSVPLDFPKDDIEYFTVQRPISTTEIKNFACRIEDTYRHGGYAS